MEDIQPIDIKQVMEIMDDDEELLIECFDDFVESMPESLGEIEKAIGLADATTLSEAAHKIKGALKYLAAETAAEVAFQIESINKKNMFDKASELFKKLNDECKRVKDFIARYKAK